MSHLPATELAAWLLPILDAGAAFPSFGKDFPRASVLRNRLAPLLVARAGLDDPLLAEAARAAWTEHSLRWRWASEWLPRLPEGGWVMLRGPLLGATLYGDAALRPYADLDVLASPRTRGACREALRSAGFRPLAEALPEAVIWRRHFHLSLLREQSGRPVLLELHWALDHRWSLPWPDTEGILARAVPAEVDGVKVASPAAEDLWLILALHLCKHLRALPRWVAEGGIEGVGREGEMLRVLDLALLWPRVDAGVVAERAEAWGAECEYRACRHLLQRLWPSRFPAAGMPPLPLPRPWHRELPNARRGTVWQRGVWRPERLREIRYGLWLCDADLYRRYGRGGFALRCRHFFRESLRLCAGALDICLSRANLRDINRHLERS